MIEVVLVGLPNVGKSMLLNRIADAETVVSNYHGTSTELFRTHLSLRQQKIEIVDTPGIYSLNQDNAETLMTRREMEKDETVLVINVLEAVNLPRNLALTLELLDTGKPMIVVLNQIDRAREKNIEIDVQELARILGCPVIPFSALTGEGVLEFMNFMTVGVQNGYPKPRPSKEVTSRVIHLQSEGCDGRCSACLKQKEQNACADEAMWARIERARTIAERTVSLRSRSSLHWLSTAEAWIDRPWAGTALLLLIGAACFEVLIRFVGWSEKVVSELFAPLQHGMTHALSIVIPAGWGRHVLSHGIPEGLLVPFALVMPAMLIVSLIMALLEDTGLLPRYAVVLERAGKLLGVSGQAFIPLSLGFGCRTPAVIASRILPSEGQRFIVIALLGIVIPCAGTIGMLSSVIAAFHASAPVVIAAMIMAFFGVGWLLKLRYGKAEEMIYELPPLRVPVLANMLTKTRMRFTGFFTEVLPLLLVMSVAVRVVLESNVLVRLQAFERVSQALFGIPAEALAAVLVTIVQRYLAPLVLLNLQLSPREATIATAMIALSVPCLPVVVVTMRETGWKNMLKIFGMGIAISAGIGMTLNLILPA